MPYNFSDPFINEKNVWIRKASELKNVKKSGKIPKGVGGGHSGL